MDLYNSFFPPFSVSYLMKRPHACWVLVSVGAGQGPQPNRFFYNRYHNCRPTLRRAHGFSGSYFNNGDDKSRGMAKKPATRSVPAALAVRRGRPPKPGGPIPQVEVQRAYRARLKAAGKVVRLVDAGSAPPSSPQSPALASIPDYDPAIDGIYDRAMFEKMRDDLHNALSQIEVLEADRNRWQTDCARAEAELRIERQHHTNTIKDKIVLQQEIAALRQKPRRSKPITR